VSVGGTPVRACRRLERDAVTLGRVDVRHPIPEDNDEKRSSS